MIAFLFVFVKSRKGFWVLKKILSPLSERIKKDFMLLLLFHAMFLHRVEERKREKEKRRKKAARIKHTLGELTKWGKKLCRTLYLLHRSLKRWRLLHNDDKNDMWHFIIIMVILWL